MTLQTWLINENAYPKFKELLLDALTFTGRVRIYTDSDTALVLSVEYGDAEQVEQPHENTKIAGIRAMIATPFTIDEIESVELAKQIHKHLKWTNHLYIQTYENEGETNLLISSRIIG